MGDLVEEVEFEDGTLDILRRLIEEGWFRDLTDSAMYAVQANSAGINGGPALDSAIEQRVSEIKKIREEAEDEGLRDFFMDTSYLMDRYASLAHDQEERIKEEKAKGHLERCLNVLEPSELENDEVDNFLNKTVDLTSDFYNLSRKADAGYEEEIDEYKARYLDEMDLESMLMSR